MDDLSWILPDGQDMEEALEEMEPMVEPIIGYDGKPYGIGDRVEIHPGTDLWMMGARYGEVVGTSITSDDRVRVVMDKVPGTRSGAADLFQKV